jgi:hypothetical protein
MLVALVTVANRVARLLAVVEKPYGSGVLWLWFSGLAIRSRSHRRGFFEA